MELFNIKNLTLEYDKNKPIVKNVSLTINKGEFISIIGPNGCGKTTLIKSLAKIMHYKKSFKSKYIDFVLSTNFKKIYSKKTLKKFDDYTSEYNNTKNQNDYENFYDKILKSNIKKILSIKILAFIAKKRNLIENDILKKTNGIIYFNKKDLYSYNSKEYAKKVSYVPQIVDFPTDVTVYDFVKMGRYPYSNFLGISDKKNKEIIEQSIELVSLTDFKNKYINELSGGQRQRALIALALAQDTNTIILDEPTNHLDIRYQLEIIHLLHDLNHKFKKTIILVVHDINHAMKFSDRIVVMKDGKICYCDNTEKIVTKKIIKEIFGVNAEIIQSDDKKIISDYWIDDLKKLKDYH